MECNKEEALRAKDIALKKMEAKDFIGARKLALKAQQLYNDVENISQIICVCDVHCAASNMIGNDLDWYAILQIEQTADDMIIKKQYRKFALLLHPDKNKFSGAEAAFKFIGEAQRLLLDKEKRRFYDMKYKTSSKLVKHQPPQQARSVGVTTMTRVQNNVPSHLNSHPVNMQGQPGFRFCFNGVETFWTQCPFCSVRYQYFKEVSNRALRCQNCKKPFIAYDILASGSQPGSDATQPVFPGKNMPNNVFGSKAGPDSVKKHAEASHSQKAKQQQKGRNKGDGEVRGSKPSMKVNSKRGKRHEEESSESFGSESSLESEDVEFEVDSLSHQFSSDGDRSTRRSSRNKRKVSYNENVSDDEQTVDPSKKAKESEPCDPPTKVDASEKSQKPFVDPSTTSREGNKGKSNYSNGNENIVDSPDRSFEVNDDDVYIQEPELYECPDPEFSDFDKLREEQCFKVGQLWAAYDTVDAMPRFYAKIRKIYSPFRLKITWLEANPDDELGVQWSNAGLPFACGKFKYGESETTEDRLMFSHEVLWKKGVGSSVLIYPRKGETWALYNNWDVNWLSIPEDDRTFKYDFVEVLSEFDENTGIIVVMLGKLKGFSSLFCRLNGNVMKIMPLEVLKFSHRVPSTRMKGDERDGVPKDSFELDPASITFTMDEISLP